jgi:Rrf2 family transcriptional regulator, iron-sulfur cluster assembly transcription factor
MRLTTKGRFAVTAMIELGLRQHRRPVTLAGIGRRQNISVSYLEQLFAKLKHHGLVASTRGPGGGYRLGREIESISVADIIFAVDGPQAASAGVENDGQSYAMQELWSRLNRQMIDFLDSVSLRDLVEQQMRHAATTSTAAGSGPMAGVQSADVLLADSHEAA